MEHRAQLPSPWCRQGWDWPLSSVAQSFWGATLSRAPSATTHLLTQVLPFLKEQESAARTTPLKTKRLGLVEAQLGALLCTQELSLWKSIGPWPCSS